MLSMLNYDEAGFRKYPAKAAQWFRRAAEQNDADAQFDLGRMYYHGEGVEQNYTEAVYWFKKAAEQKGKLPYVFGHNRRYSGGAVDYRDH